MIRPKPNKLGRKMLLISVIVLSIWGIWWIGNKKSSVSIPKEPSATVAASEGWKQFKLPDNTDIVMSSDDPRAEVCVMELKPNPKTGQNDCPRPWLVSQNIGAGVPNTVYFRSSSPVRLFYLPN